MIYKADSIYKRLKHRRKNKQLVIVPFDTEDFKESNSSSIDLRLGTRFLSTAHSRCLLLDIIKYNNTEKEKTVQNKMDNINDNINIYGNRQMMENHYIPFGKPFILHPKDFVLGATLEWIKLPYDIAGYVQGKSNWGRRGLVIATAVGVHTGFSGCLTLEITNLGEVPIAIYPGLPICQLFLHKVETSIKKNDKTNYFGKTKPVLGEIKISDIDLNLTKRR